MSRPDSGNAGEWLTYARSDLALAELSHPSGVLLESLCFHAQQAAEKAIKAVLIANGIRPAHTHDIDVLIAALENVIDVPAGVRAAGVLAQYAVLSRYPGDFGEVDEDEWRTSAKQARLAVEWAAGVIDTSL